MEIIVKEIRTIKYDISVKDYYRFRKNWVGNDSLYEIEMEENGGVYGPVEIDDETIWNYIESDIVEPVDVELYTDNIDFYWVEGESDEYISLLKKLNRKNKIENLSGVIAD